MTSFHPIYRNSVFLSLSYISHLIWRWSLVTFTYIGVVEFQALAGRDPSIRKQPPTRYPNFNEKLAAVANSGKGRIGWPPLLCGPACFLNIGLCNETSALQDCSVTAAVPPEPRFLGGGGGFAPYPIKSSALGNGLRAKLHILNLPSPFKIMGLLLAGRYIYNTYGNLYTLSIGQFRLRGTAWHWRRLHGTRA